MEVRHLLVRAFGFTLSTYASTLQQIILKKNTGLILLFFISLISATTSLAQSETNSISENHLEKIDVYEGVSNPNRPTIKYSPRQRSQRLEGWIDVQYMVDADGTTFEPIIIDNSKGAEIFIPTVIKNINESTFEPAKIGGTPVESSYSMRYRFQIDKLKGVSTAFQKSYSFFNRALAEKNKKNADKYLASLNKKKLSNLYEDTYLNLANFHYEYVYGSTERQLYYLSRAIKDSGQARYLDPKTYTSYLTRLFSLEIELKHYAEAITTYRRIARQEGTFELVSQFESTIDAIEELQTNDDSYFVPATINEQGKWSIKLLKPSFTFQDLEGKLDEIQLRCSAKYVFFTYLPEKDYHIPKKYGRCTITLLGDSNTTLKLVQMPGIEPSKS